MNTAQYTILRLHPYPWRSEHLNIGIVVLRGDGVRVHLADNLKKVRVFAPDVDLDTVRGWPAELQGLLNGASGFDEAAKRMALWGSLQQLSEQRGSFGYQNESEYALRVANALDRLVVPERTAKKPSESGNKSRLDIELKTAFTAYGWLSTDHSKIFHHIIPKFPIDANTGLKADFAVQNGRLHVIETIDFRVADPSTKREAAQAKALVMTLAKDARCYAIVAGGDGEDTMPSMRLLKAQSDMLIRWEDTGAVNSFLSEMGSATGKPMLAMPTT